MKKLLFVILATALAAALVGCDNYTPAQIPVDIAESGAETGYPAGEVQTEAVMYNGRIFVHDNNGFRRPLPEGYELVGTVQNVDDKKLPTENFAACQVREGQEIYADPTVGDIIYLQYSEGYALFKAESAVKITAGVKDVTRTGLTLVLSYESEPCDTEFHTGSQFHIEKYVDGGWVEPQTLAPEEEFCWTAIAYIIPCASDPEFSRAEIETHWSHMYGELSAGRYRVVKSVGEYRGVADVTSHTVYAEFEIMEATE